MSFRKHRRAGGQRPGRAPIENPAEFFFGDSRPKTNYKDQQLCRQVQRVLTTALPSLADELLQNLVVESVQPAPNASRLLVLLYPATPTSASILQYLEKLNHAAPILRREVAAGIVRKRAPELLFQIIPRQEVEHE